LKHLQRAALGALAGAALGAIFLGLGGRIVMRLLALIIARDGVFSVGGSLEVIAYGAIVGGVSGAAYSVSRPYIPSRWWIQGILLGGLTFAGTIVTLPAHIAETARPFGGHMAIVFALFGLCFALFGLALARLLLPRR